MICDLVLQGGGANGLFQAHVLLALSARGYTFRRAIGTSVGAIAAASVKSMTPLEYVNLFEGIGTKDVMKKPWWDALAYAGLLKHTGMYDWSPLRSLLAKHLPAEDIPDCWVTRTNAETEQLEVVPANAESVFDSALMPIIGRFVEFYDGGVREQIPLGKGLDVGIGEDGTLVVIVMCSPYEERPHKPHRVKTGLDAIQSVGGAMMREIRDNDLHSFLLINWFCKQLGGPLPRPQGGHYTYYPVEVWAPGMELGDAMDFDNEKLKEGRRREAILALERGPIVDPV